MKDNWKVCGNILVKHNNATIANAFGDTVPLKGVKVKVSAREKLLGVWGPFNKWGEDVTDDKGFFKVENDKDKSDRQFKIEVLFKDDTLKIYPENDGLINKITETATDVTGGLIGDKLEDALEQVLEQTSRIAFDVRWFKVLDEDKNDKDHNPGTVNFGNLVFGGGSSKADLSDIFAIRHATAWFVIKKVFEVINTFNSKCKFSDTPVALKYPHDNKLIGDKVEAPYTDPYNHVIFVIKNTRSDWFSVDTVIHELMHAWAFQHCTREKAMAWQLLIHGGTHDGLQKKSFVAFHEGFAEWASNRLTRMIFSADSDIYGGTVDNGLPFSKKFLKSKGVKNSDDIDKSEYGWISLFNILMTPDLHLYDFNSTTDYAVKLSSVSIPKDHICSSPSLTFEKILSVFCINESQGYEKVLDKKEMNFNDFLQRTVNINDLSNGQIQAIKKLLDPSDKSQAVDIICVKPNKPKPPEDFKPPKDLRNPPIINKKK